METIRILIENMSFYYESLNRCWDPRRDFQKVFIEILKESNNNAFHLDVVISQGISYCFRLERMIGELQSQKEIEISHMNGVSVFYSDLKWPQPN